MTLPGIEHASFRLEEPTAPLPTPAPYARFREIILQYSVFRRSTLVILIDALQIFKA